MNSKFKGIKRMREGDKEDRRRSMMCNKEDSKRMNNNMRHRVYMGYYKIMEI